MWRSGLGVLAFIGLTGAIIAGVMAGLDASPRLLFSDPAAYAGEPPYLGMFSALSVMAWTAGAAIALFGWAAVAPDAPGRRALLHVGMLTAVLAIDDQFQLHETVGPDIGIPQMAFAVAYAGAAGALAAKHGTVVWRGPRAWLVGAVVLLGLSMAIDAVGDAMPLLGAWGMLIAVEEAAKLIGALLWTGYLAGLARRIARGQAALTE